MKKYFLRILGLAMALIVVPMLVVSCADDEKVPLTSNSAGTFSIINVSDKSIYYSSDTILIVAKKDGSQLYSNMISRGDTLVVTFNPQSSYSTLPFEKSYILEKVSSGELINVGDTIFTGLLHADSYKVHLKATYNEGGYDLSATKYESIKIPKTIIKDDEAGSFSVWNLTTNKELIEADAYVGYGDSIKVLFTPKKEYGHIPFKVRNSFTRENDSIYKVPILRGTNPFPFAMNATYQAETGDTIYNLFAGKSIPAKYSENFAMMNIRCWINGDLLSFVTPELIYIDNDNKEKKHLFGEKDIDNQDYFGTRWIKDLRFDNRNNFTLTLRYIPKDNYVLTKDFYNLVGGFSATPSLISWYDDVDQKDYTYISSAAFNSDFSYKEVSKEDVQNYIDMIVANPLSIKFQIDEIGKISQIED